MTEMMTADRIVECALCHFAEHGYEGTALSAIAEQVGIKTPSIYAHFKSKDDLFLQVVEHVIEHETRFLNSYLDGQQSLSLQARLKGLLEQYNKRYEHSDHAKFLFRFMLFPPAALVHLLHDPVYAYLDHVEELLVPHFASAMQRGEIAVNDERHAAVAFACLLDGLLVERLYGGPARFERRLEACWPIYWGGLTA
ncbi:TetR/AcrR family transcriptional regulator [Paenibacillus senegalensis]|uniref:TetR/AcrR family transcriptional regulator n=1 Tax=Paenibacillus senegalensis TaxID=1465766 RepID=UPI00028A4131|nr:TetR/AcrR family transcriptional regulator [Paenibacillus senegalensis]